MTMGEGERGGVEYWGGVDEGSGVDDWGGVDDGSGVVSWGVVGCGVVGWGVVSHDALGGHRGVVVRQQTGIGGSQHGAEGNQLWK